VLIGVCASHVKDTQVLARPRRREYFGPSLKLADVAFLIADCSTYRIADTMY
jgi:hypothetical protein